MKKGDALDPKGLIFESYRIEGITAEECRSVFLDWALSLPVDTDTAPLLTKLLGRYREGAPNHPMTQVLEDGLKASDQPRRRGGRQARLN